MNDFNALSIMYPAVENILRGKKEVEIRSWLPPVLPLKDLILVENNIYLRDGEVDPNAEARAIVDVINVSEWTYEDFLSQSNDTKINKTWKEGYYKWHLANVRELRKPFICAAKKGIYNLGVIEEELL